jgi:hypothetical protein
MIADTICEKCEEMIEKMLLGWKGRKTERRERGWRLVE